MILYYEAFSMLFTMLLCFVVGMTLFILIMQSKLTAARLKEIVWYQIAGAAANGGAALLYADMFQRGPLGWMSGVLLVFMGCMVSFLYMTRMWRMV